jgi:uncharacterized membrane protein
MKAFTLWFGMYCVTLALFTYETGDPLKGAVFGLVAATLKTLWSMAHNRLWRCSKPEVRLHRYTDPRILQRPTLKV